MLGSIKVTVQNFQVLMIETCHVHFDWALHVTSVRVDVAEVRKSTGRDCENCIFYRIGDKKSARCFEKRKAALYARNARYELNAGPFMAWYVRKTMQQWLKGYRSGRRCEKQ